MIRLFLLGVSIFLEFFCAIMFKNTIPFRVSSFKLMQVMMNITVGHVFKKAIPSSEFESFLQNVLGCATVHLEVMEACIHFLLILF